ncbi:ATP-binding protein [Planctobacterium marinum]|uniref:histidine kinase n=1 Tax=Planctobacterium marinum TaxID=1631968 RepID=A0AA48HHL6_9ALTE|nr:hypothetical protein MACH26_25940 [Planctobacterium marinum]
MVQLNKLRRSRSLLLKLVSAIGVFTLLIAALLFFSISEKNALEEQLKHIHKAASDIIYYDEVLTMSARMFTYTNDEKWWQRYESAASTLDEVLIVAAKLDPQIAQAIINTSASNDRLIELETAAFNAAREGNNDRASDLLLNTAYQNLKAQYSNGVEKALEIVQFQTEEKLLKGQEQKARFLLALALILAISLVTLLIFLLRYNSHIDTSIDTLHQSLAQKVDELQQTTNALTAATNAKNRFLANLSHEIRTPMHGVMGNLQLLNTMSLSEEAQKALDNSIGSSKLLSRLLADLLDFSDMQSGTLVLKSKTFQLANLLNELAAMFRTSCNNKGLQFILQNEHQRDGWQGDPERLMQLLTQLIDNAIKYTDLGSVTLRVGLKQDTQVQFDVIDTGIGMTEATKANLFTPFEQGDNSNTRRSTGAGIGMAYVKSLVELMQGEITVVSDTNKGTTISVVLPLEPINLSKPDDGEQSAFSLPSNTKILVAEDNKINQLIVESMLVEAGTEVILVDNGIEAIAAINRRFDLVLMDIQMPEMDGIEACERFKLQKPNLPVIALTANVLQEDIALYQKTGFDDVLSKPVDKNELLATINKHL